MKNFIKTIREMKTFLLLWSTQALSGLGSAMTSYALVIWSYTQKGSALTTVVMLVLLYTDRLQIWHLYLINGVNGLMNTVQQPASEVAVTRVLPKEHYQRVGGLRYFSGSLNSIMTPVIATAVMGIAGMGAIVAFDLLTFAVAFLVLLFGIRIPETEEDGEEQEKLMASVKKGITYLKKEQGIFGLILFLAAINLVASIYDAAFPAMILSRNGGSERALGLANAVIGIATLTGSILASFSRTPKSRVRVICNCLLFSMSTENFLLAFGRTPVVWCVGGFLGWIAIPLMNTNLDAIMRLHIPEKMQGRVYSVRNSLQFFTIPLGYFLGGLLVDQVFEPIMAVQREDSILSLMFGFGKGFGAAFLFFVIAFAGIGVCLYFRRNKHIWELEGQL